MRFPPLLVVFGLSCGLFAAAPAPAQTIASPAYASPIPPPDAPSHSAVASAAAEESYVINGVAVDVTATSAAAARDKAIFDGQRAALTQLLERLDASKGVDPAKLSDNKIAALVKNFEITSEKASSVRYIATLNVRFKPRAIERLLTNAGVSYAVPTLPTVLLPISDSNGRPVLWEESTPWHTALAPLEQETGSSKTVIPNGELNDVSAVDARGAIAGNAAGLGALATLHGAGSIVVAQLQDDVAKLVPQQPLTLKLSRYDSGGRLMETQTVSLPPAISMAAQMSTASKMVQNFVQHKPLVPPAPVQRVAQMQLYAPLASLSELTRLRQRLNGISAIQRINIQSLTRDGAEIGLEFSGDAALMQQALAQQGIAMLQAPSGQWQIRSN